MGSSSLPPEGHKVTVFPQLVPQTPSLQPRLPRRVLGSQSTVLGPPPGETVPPTLRGRSTSDGTPSGAELMAETFTELVRRSEGVGGGGGERDHLSVSAGDQKGSDSSDGRQSLVYCLQATLCQSRQQRPADEHTIKRACRQSSHASFTPNTNGESRRTRKN
ncbi:hypothetical protein BaRGS_00029681 [Batillaria attramentaria]|uniref:Uncharacterized protein n=1 Tax=Batillaria attramentaria TaxID=370345 RepID=A0ABD0JVI6_9CAEN